MHSVQSREFRNFSSENIENIEISDTALSPLILIRKYFIEIIVLIDIYYMILKLIDSDMN